MALCEREALLNVESAARELAALFDSKDDGPFARPGDLDEWKLDGRRATGVASLALLSLHDYLNDVTNARHAGTLRADYGGEHDA